MSSATQTTTADKSAFDLRQEEYLAARRAGAEAIEVGRETLETVSRQGEQLHHAEQMADETGYKLDKAGRILRGMTWSGWVANIFSTDVKRQQDGTAQQQQGNDTLVPSVYEDAPPVCRDAAQAVQNYNANLKVLTTCETDEQLETCHLICENMYRVALTEINKLLSTTTTSEAMDMDETSRVFVQKLQKDLTNLRSRQQIKKRYYERQKKEAQAYAQSRETLQLGDTTAEQNNNNKPRNDVTKELVVATDDPQAQKLLDLQNQHLAGISQHLDELGNLALNLGEATEKQAAMVEILDTKSDTILDKSRMVTRRADRMIQQKAWTPAKPTFQSTITIQHVPTQKYLAIANGYLVLRSHLDTSESCIFEVWKRQGSIFGLLSKFNRKWVGQNMLGSLECRASSFGRRQEFETEKEWKATPLLCASAGWGAGSYVVVSEKDHVVNIAPTGSVTGRVADLWCFREIH
ncbi:expressed unknown protein [Seminavis robusta]|uniref:t-SNARE coiled-coil homology domain-containing protein n=1 Tax=Seminavis robusta TaxID=568900 RepID=A0A9N8EUD3_9STRA|nr:expressed unknown protein [Seminavis robusta]|eukprot:Sro1600_g285040.1 n/a (464) ;mRNA; f:12675-14255